MLTGCISSCEDHGYVVDIGVKGVSAFLNTAEAEKYTSAYGEGLRSCTAVRSRFCGDIFMPPLPILLAAESLYF